MNACDVEGAVRAWADRRHLDPAHLAQWLALDAESAAALLDTAARLRMRAGQVRSALEMLEEIAVVDSITVAAVLARPSVVRILEGTGAAPARARALLEALRAMRFPRLGRALAGIRAEIAALGLPRTVVVIPPGELGSDELRIELRVRSGAELGGALSALGEKMDAMVRILDLLAGRN